MRTNTLETTLLKLERQKEPEEKPSARAQKKDISASHANRKTAGKVLIAGHYDPEVRAALFMVQAQKSYHGRSLQDILGEAINDLCAKNRLPRPYRLDKPVDEG